MRWYNPSQEEARQGYYDARKRYANAANQYKQNESLTNQCFSEYSSVRSEIGQTNSEKMNFEKRIEQIGSIIDILEGRREPNVPQKLQEERISASRSEEAMKLCIKCSETSSPSLGSAFRLADVNEDINSSQALQLFQKEKARLEQAVEDLKNKINNMENRSQELISRMNALNAEKISSRKNMMSSVFEMAHFKKYM